MSISALFLETHRPSTSEGMPHPRNFLSDLPISPSYSFILALFSTSWGTGFFVSCSIALIFVYYLRILSAESLEAPLVFNFFFVSVPFSRTLSLARVTVVR